MTSFSLADTDTGGADAELSHLLQARVERDRLERVLLMLPAALAEFVPERSAEVFAKAACELASARVALVVLPELLRGPVGYGRDIDSLAPDLDLMHLAAFAPAFDGNLVHIPDTTRMGRDAGHLGLGPTTDGRELRTLLVLPVRGREHGGAAGVLCLAHHRSDAFSSRQIALARGLAALLGRTIEVTDTVTEQTRISTALQRSLLPPLLPSIPGLDIAARYRPSGPGNLVGGDFYDVFPNGVGDWDILLGDASGIGPEAAGLAGVARYTARALADSAPPPAGILGQLNKALLRAAPAGRFCSAVLAEFTPAPGGFRVVLASGGHPPAYVQRRDATVAPAMTATGTILGIVDDASVGDAQLSLTEGDALVFYTDGVLEARDDAGAQFGEERLRQVLVDAAGRSAEGIARRLELAVLEHRGARNSDDVAIVVARASRSGSLFTVEQ